MNDLEKKTVRTKRNFTYTYYTSPAVQGKATILLQHGFPDSALVWEFVITRCLVPANYGIIAPDMLGYADTDKPEDPAQYKMSGIAADLVDILDAEGVQKVISLGHDWGSRTAQALYNHYPHRVEGLALFNLTYIPVTTQPFNLDAANEASLQRFGHGMFCYWKLFTADDGPQLLQENADVLFDILHTPEVWQDLLCVEGALRTAIETRGADLDLTRRAYATEEMKQAFVERFRRDGFEAPVCYYKSMVLGHQDGDGNIENNIVRVPVFYVGYNEDFLCKHDLMSDVMRDGFTPRLTMTRLTGGHWGFLENPSRLGAMLMEWLGYRS
ncbi:alpha/beta-hydrolase [Cryphonectria parasitica EP155]|uniref:Alpha/beta-hydrolase n=1 Tax=Cryphonectria parasitica (strain ATCC 38755 / EP155) TaxID=660469 RepID=A0A9P4XQV9_CRYP1|nr:alpha/beta-hydrolase [Cryphonectria parasitica EP155]KAF3759997.1 alpha/beta-hydrolase [Cryphonectria parasitica EP155]